MTKKRQPKRGAPVSRLVTIDGVTRTVSEWAARSDDVDATLIHARLRMGWSPRTAVFAPPAPTRRGAEAT